MESLLKAALLALVLAPVLLFFLLVALAHLMPAPSTVARASFTCPLSRRRVNVAFLTTPGADQPVDVVSCSAFPDPERVRCAKGCLGWARSAWNASPMVARYALLAGGESYRGAGGQSEDDERRPRAA